MVWCCGPVEALTPEEGVNDLVQKQNDSSYPGQRRQFSRTSGSTLFSTVSASNGREGDDLVSVTVPKGIPPGQTIAVMAPDGSRLVRATIPTGLNPGDTFLVRLAPRIEVDVQNAHPVQSKPTQASAPAQPNFADALDSWLTPSPDIAVVTPMKVAVVNPMKVAVVTPMEVALVTSMKVNDKRDSIIADAVAAPVPDNNDNTDDYDNDDDNKKTDDNDNITNNSSNSDIIDNKNNDTAKASHFQKVLGQPVNAQVEHAETRQEHDSRNPSLVAPDQPPTPTSPPASPLTQKLLLVHVPHGILPGATMQVEVPGENRTLTAQVPPGVQSFHVAYTPQPQIRMPAPPQQPVVQHPQSPIGQKLLLVRVPPGTPPGTTLHVSVPDEPGRILAAQVPPGNVQEFHVSYEARHHLSPSRRTGMTPPANAYASGIAPYHNAPTFNGYHQASPANYHQAASPNYHHQQQHRMATSNSNNKSNNGGGNYLLPFIGGAAAGAAGVATYDHFAHTNNNYDTGADYGDDMGGDDFGGGYDY